MSSKFNEFKQLVIAAPKCPGVYLFYKSDHRILYVGKAKNLFNRLSDYIHSSDYKTSLLVNNTAQVKFIRLKTEDEALLKEAELIAKYNPPYNYRLGVASRYYVVLQKTTILVPKISLIRDEKLPKEFFLGPLFVSSAEAKQIFTYIQEKTQIRCCIDTLFNQHSGCLYNDLGLCSAPCLLNNLRAHNYRTYKARLIRLYETDQKILSILNKQ